MSDQHYTLHPTPYTPHPTPYTLKTTPYKLGSTTARMRLPSGKIGGLSQLDVLGYVVRPCQFWSEKRGFWESAKRASGRVKKGLLGEDVSSATLSSSRFAIPTELASQIRPLFGGTDSELGAKNFCSLVHRNLINRHFLCEVE